MNVLYTSQKLHELFCDDSLPSHGRASGDGDGIPGRCCRLCGGDNNLRYFGDTYVWQDVEERYDQLLNDCFGVKRSEVEFVNASENMTKFRPHYVFQMIKVTTTDCMICEWCVRALRTTERFRALVHAAFDKQNSDRNEAKKAWEKLRNNHRDALRRQSKPKSGPGAANIRPWRFQDNMAFLIPHMANRYTHTSEDMQNDDTSQVSSSLGTIKSSTSVKKAVEFATMTEKDSVNAKSTDLPKAREDRKRLLGVGGDVKGKRTNIPCEICKQRYPMLIMNARDTSKPFVCSRCKKTGDLKGRETCAKCNVVMPINQMAEHLQMHLKADLRTKFKELEKKRAQLLTKKVVPIELPKLRTQKYQCSQCPKKYALARQLATHVRNAHGDTMDNICCVCNQDMESNEKLQEHLLQHSGLHQCDECLLIFKNKRILAAHVASKHHD